MKEYSLLREMKRQGKITEDFENQLSSLTIEEIIALKLEVASKAVKGKFYGFPLYFSLPSITKEAVFKWAVSICDTKSSAARLLGISLTRFNQIYKKLDIDNFFSKSS